MIEHISKFQRSTESSYRFCLLIPSWNNLEYLKVCLNSIQKNSHFKVQVIVIANEGSDGTVQWLESNTDVDYIHAEKNIGICYALNIARSLIRSDYVVFVNDDMYVLPDWDLELYREIEKIGHRNFMLSATMIEPVESGNPCVVVKDYGRNLQDFNEELLLSEYSGLSVGDWSGSTWPPTVVHIDMWDLVGGYSIEFSPGLGSDPDLSRKLFEAGVRIFKGKGTSLVYHFSQKSTGRIKRNKGKHTFQYKWRISTGTFKNKYLKIGEPYSGSLVEPKLSRISKLINRIKRI